MKLISNIFIIIFLFLQSSQFVLPSNILFFHLVATPSHRISIWPLAEKLADEGHHVTYIFPMSNPPHQHPKIEELLPSKMVPILKDYVGNFDINFRLNNSVDQWTSKLFSKCLQLCEAFYDSPEIIKWLAKPNLHYDLILIDALPGDCAYGLVHRFKAKHVLFTPVIPHFIWDAVGIVPESSSIPEGYFHKKPGEMTIINRLLGTFAFISWRFEFLNFLSEVEKVIQNKLKFPETDKLPSLIEFEQNTSLILVNSYFVEDYVMAFPPIIQSYSGLWCSEEILPQLEYKSRLQNEFLHFLEANSEDNDGFVFVSFGSSVVASAMPSSERQKFFDAFKSFSRLKFLWTWDGEVPEDKPKNVILRPFYPQQELLAHPKIKGFITHSGRSSVQEALCFGVPMISMAIYADQDYNADRLEHIGASITLDIGNITKAALRKAIMDIVYSNIYKNRMKELSEIYRDRPLDPLQNALYWIEYVLRHKDTSHLKPLGMKQTWYQRRLIDVYAIVGIIAFIVAITSVIIMYFIVKCAIRASLIMFRKDKQD